MNNRINNSLMAALLLIWCLGGALPVTAQDSQPTNTVTGKYPMRIYGFVKFEALFDNSEVAQGDWLLFVRPGDSPEAGQEVFSMNARHSRVGVQIDCSSAADFGKITALIEADFAGGFPNSGTAVRQPRMRLRHAWVDVSNHIWEVRFGQDWALISSPFPNTTSFVVGAGKGNLWMRFPQVRGTVKVGSARFALSLNRPMAGNIKYDDYANGSFDFVGDGERTGLPWIMWRHWIKAGPVALSASGHYGRERILDLSDDPHGLTSFSINANSVVEQGAASITVSGFYGENLNSFFGGVFQGFTRGIESVSNVRSNGGWAQLVLRLSPTWAMTLGGGLDNPKDSDMVPGMRSRNEWLFSNVSFTPAPPLRLMLEAQHLRTSFLEGETGENTRIQFVTYLKF